MWHLVFQVSVLVSSVAGLMGPDPLRDRLYAIGGKDQFVFELEKLSRHASALRNGINTTLVPLGEGSSGYVTRVQFEDGISWTAKVSENFENEAEQGVMALKPLNNTASVFLRLEYMESCTSLGNSSFRYYFMNWIDGHSLQDTQEYVMNYRGPGEYEITIPNRVIPQVAQFIHNLTTCPIPPHISMVLRCRWFNVLQRETTNLRP